MYSLYGAIPHNLDESACFPKHILHTQSNFLAGLSCVCANEGTALSEAAGISLIDILLLLHVIF